MTEREYPKQRSKVTVTFDDGEIKDYEITAGPSITNHLVNDARVTGTLILRNDKTSHAIPYDRVREFEIELIAESEDAE